MVIWDEQIASQKLIRIQKLRLRNLKNTIQTRIGWMDVCNMATEQLIDNGFDDQIWHLV